MNEEKVLVLYSILLLDVRPTHEKKTHTHTLPPSLTHPNLRETLINCTGTINKIVLLLINWDTKYKVLFKEWF